MAAAFSTLFICSGNKPIVGIRSRCYYVLRTVSAVDVDNRFQADIL